MLIKKDEIFTFMHGLCDERDRPMIATQEFDLSAIANQLIQSMDDYDKQAEVDLLHERLEDLGLARPLQQTLIRLGLEADHVVLERAEEEPRVTKKPETDTR